VSVHDQSDAKTIQWLREHEVDRLHPGGGLLPEVAVTKRGKNRISNKCKRAQAKELAAAAKLEEMGRKK
jgi:hypothetical protein